MDVDEIGLFKLVLELVIVVFVLFLVDEDEEGVVELVEIVDCVWFLDCCCCFILFFCVMVGNRLLKSKIKKK